MLLETGAAAQTMAPPQPPDRRGPPPRPAVRLEAGPARFRIDPDSRAEAADRRRMERDLAAATREGNLVLQYQPRVDLGSGRITGAEAVIRWPHRKRGMVSPGQLLPLAERSGQLIEIGGWALRAASSDALAWAADRMVSVAVSASQVEASALLGQVAVALSVSGLAPERLELALGEALLNDCSDDVFLMLCAIRDRGVGLALDDFGAGVASLCLLRRLPLTTLKLDRAMVRDVAGGGADAALARAAIDAAHALGLTVVASGLETEPQRICLAAAGCDQGQGALIGFPVPAEQVSELAHPQSPDMTVAGASAALLADAP